MSWEFELEDVQPEESRAIADKRGYPIQTIVPVTEGTPSKYAPNGRVIEYIANMEELRKDTK